MDKKTCLFKLNKQVFSILTYYFLKILSSAVRSQ